MRKRLENAFDTMKMPEDCARRIEQQLVKELRKEGKKETKTGREQETWTMRASDTPRKSWWAVAAAAACMVLVMLTAPKLIPTMIPENKEADESQTMQTYESEAPSETAENGKTEFTSVLMGNGTFYSHDYEKDMSMDEYCETFGAGSEITLAVPKFTVVDMDGDGIGEIVLWLQVNSSNDYGTMVLRYQDGKVHGYSFTYLQLNELKADGTFHWSGSASYNGTGVLKFTGTECAVERTLYIESGEDDVIRYYQDGTEITEEAYWQIAAQQDAKESVQWHTYPCENLDGIF